MLNNYKPFYCNFKTGVVITGLGTTAPYAFDFIDGTIVRSLVLIYLTNSNSIDEAIKVVTDEWSLTDRITFDASNIIDTLKTNIKKTLILK